MNPEKHVWPGRGRVYASLNQSGLRSRSSWKSGGLAILLVLGLAPFAAAQKQKGEQPKAQRKNEGTDFIRRRDEWFYRQRAFPLARIPAGARLRALQQLHQMLAAQKEQGTQFGIAATALGTTQNWVAIGPQPTSSSFFQPFTSGRVTAIAPDPTNSDIAYLGAAEGGVWKTIDGGTTWTALTDSQPSLAIGSIAIDPSSCSPAPCKTIYVGTGESNFAGDSYFGAGVLKSTDGGTTWTQLGAGVFAGPFASPELRGGAHIGGLAVSPDGKALLAAVKIFSVGSSDGIYRSTDGGTTWANVLPGAAGTSVLFDPTNPSVAYAALGFVLGSAANGIYRSTNGGATWTKLTVGSAAQASFGRIDLTISASNPTTSTVYAAIEDASSIAVSDSLLGVFKTTNGGTTWSLTGAPSFCTGQCFYDLVIRVSPTNPNLVFAGGSAPGFGGGAATLVRSVNGGSTWADVSNNRAGSTTGLHVDMHALAFSADGSKLYNGNDGGVWSAIDLTATPIAWNNLNQTLGITQFYPGMSNHPSNPTFLTFGGTQDNDTQKHTGNPTWTDLGVGCDGGYSAIDPNFPSTMYGTCEGIFIYKSLFLGDSRTLFEVDFGIDFTDPSAFIAPLTIDFSNPQRLYFGTCRVWQTTDGANTWAPISPDLTGSVGADCLNAQGVLKAIAVAPNASNTIYAGSQNARVAVTTNGGTNWTDISTGLPPRVVTDIAVDPLVSTTAYVAFSGFSGFVDNQGHVFQTTNNGSSWTDISTSAACVAPQGTLPNIPVNDIVVDPDLPGTLYVATDIGVFQGSLQPTGGACWLPLGMTSLPHVVVLSLKLHRPSRTLFAASHGRSVWELNLGGLPPFGLATISPASAKAGDAAFPLTVTGSGFTSSSVVQWTINGTTDTLTQTSSSSLPDQFTVNVPQKDIAGGGVAQVQVFDPGQPAPGTTKPLLFTVLNPAPEVTSISPTNATAPAAADLSLIVNDFAADGTGFVSTSTVQLSRLSTFTTTNFPTTLTSSGQVKATVAQSFLQFGGIFLVSVLNPLPGGGTSNPFFNSSCCTFVVKGPKPTNDDFSNASTATNAYTDTVDSSGATTQSTDPIPGCTFGVVNNGASNSVWYRFAANGNGTIEADTFGSVYDTILSVWTGSLGSLTPVACNDDANLRTDLTSQVTFPATSGTTYFFMVSAFGGDGGKTVFNLNANLSPPPNYVASATPLNPSAIKAGGFATSTITLAPQPASTNGTITLSCIGLPAKSSCSFSPSNMVSLGSSAVSVTLTISTTAPSAVFPLPSSRQDRLPVYVLWLGLASTALLFALLGTRRLPQRRLGFGIACALLLGMLVFQISCGGGGGGNSSPQRTIPGTPSGTFTITIVGTPASSGGQAPPTVTLVVQ